MVEVRQEHLIWRQLDEELVPAVSWKNYRDLLPEEDRVRENLVLIHEVVIIGGFQHCCGY